MFRDLSDRLNLSRDEGEKWIVNLIRETRMGADAKIDLEKVRQKCFFFILLVVSPRFYFDVITWCPNPCGAWAGWDQFSSVISGWESPAPWVCIQLVEFSRQ